MPKEREKGKDTNRMRQRRKTKQRRKLPRRRTKTRSNAYPHLMKHPTPGKACARSPQLAVSFVLLNCRDDVCSWRNALILKDVVECQIILNASGNRRNASE